MNPGQRLRRYRERQLELLASYGELQARIEEAARAGQADLLALQAVEARRLAAECLELELAARPLAGRESGAGGGRAAEGDRLRELEARLAAGRESALEASRRSQAALSDSLRELAACLRELQARPRTPPSPFARIGQPRMIDLES
jgi:hypothetical protein